MVRLIKISLLALAVLFGLVMTNFVAPGSRTIGQIENIHGIPYPKLSHQYIISENLTHTDIFLKESVLAQNLILDLTYLTHDTQELSVGIRENSFWLSYPRHQLPVAPTDQPQSHTLKIPLTNKLQEPDRSIDLMFMASGETVYWELLDLNVRTEPALPSIAHLKDFVRSLLTRERAL